MNSFNISFFLYLCVLSLVYSKENSLTENTMYIRLGEKIFSINLYENPIKKEILSLMPLKSIPVDKNNFKYLPLSLEIEKDNSMMSQDDEVIQADIGDVFLFRRKEIIIVNKKTEFENFNGEYIKLGKTEFTNELYDIMKYNKTVYLWNSYNYANYNEKIKPNEHYMSIMNFLTWKILTVICFLFL